MKDINEWNGIPKLDYISRDTTKGKTRLFHEIRINNGMVSPPTVQNWR